MEFPFKHLKLVAASDNFEDCPIPLGTKVLINNPKYLVTSVDQSINQDGKNNIDTHTEICAREAKQALTRDGNKGNFG